MLALVNLESYAYDDDVRLTARMLLDYISAKVAVSSNDLRRATPFRRRNEDERWGPSVPGGFFLRSPLLVAKSDYPDPPPPGVFEPDPQGPWYAVFAGNTSLVPSGNARGVPGKGNFALGMVFGGLHDYRVPDLILDLFVNPSSRVFYQRFHHGHFTRNSGELTVVDELYAGSPSYLITAGGHPTIQAYKGCASVGIEVVCSGKTSDLGSAMPTTFMPTGSGLTLESMVQFGQYTDLITDNGPVKHHMCVAPDFACGIGVYRGDLLTNAPGDPPGHSSTEAIPVASTQAIIWPSTTDRPSETRSGCWKPSIPCCTQGSALTSSRPTSWPPTARAGLSTKELTRG